MPFLSFLAPVIGALAGGLGSSMAGERSGENAAIQNQNDAASRLYGTRQNAVNQLLALAESGALNRAKLGLEAPNVRSNQILRGSLMANTKPASFSGLPARVASRIPQMSGGLTPASLSPAARSAGAEMQRQALAALLSGSDVPAMPNYSSGLLAPPELQGYKSPSALETILGVAGAGANAINAGIEARNKNRQPLPSRPTPTQYAGLPAPIRATGV